MDSPHSQLCNIGGREISKRRWVAVATLILSVAIETGFVVGEASRWWRLALLPLLYVAILGFLQAHAKVCVRNAISGIRNMGDGNEAVNVDSERNALRGRGLTIIAQAAAGAVIITAILILMHV
jgi:hypothetical protein